MKNQGIQRGLTIAIAVLLLAGGTVLAGCGATESPAPTSPAATDGDTQGTPDAAAAETATTEPAPETATPVIPTTEPEPSGPTAETLAASGQEVFAAECAECHGQKGEGVIGPKLLGDGNNLYVYGTAEKLYNFVHLTMPQDAPGSLSDEQYLQTIAFLLLENGYVAAGDPLATDQLAGISLE